MNTQMTAADHFAAAEKLLDHAATTNDIGAGGAWAARAQAHIAAAQFLLNVANQYRRSNARTYEDFNLTALERTGLTGAAQR